jgi:hypothetical protein
VDFPGRAGWLLSHVRYREVMQRSLMTTTPDISGVRLLP